MEEREWHYSLSVMRRVREPADGFQKGLNARQKVNSFYIRKCRCTLSVALSVFDHSVFKCLMTLRHLCFQPTFLCCTRTCQSVFTNIDVLFRLLFILNRHLLSSEHFKMTYRTDMSYHHLFLIDCFNNKIQLNLYSPKILLFSSCWCWLVGLLLTFNDALLLCGLDLTNSTWLGCKKISV